MALSDRNAVLNQSILNKACLSLSKRLSDLTRKYQQEKAEENLRMELQRCPVPDLDADGFGYMCTICEDHTEKSQVAG